jgi:hypothetical protein
MYLGLLFKEVPMFLKSIAVLAASLALASSALASASVEPGKGSKAGIVAADGSIVLGTGFSVSHDGTGEYTIDVPTFPDCPAILVTPAGVNGHAPIVNDYNYITCNTGGGEVKIQIRIYSRTDGSRQDNSFHFLMAKT